MARVSSPASVARTAAAPVAAGSQAWRRDLRANGFTPTPLGALQAWFLSPAFKLLSLHRWAVAAQRGGRLSRAWSGLLWRWSVAGSACYLSPLARIAPGLSLPHPTGIVIGEGVRIGADCTIFQNVTIGQARGSRVSCPQVGHSVTIYAGAVIAADVRIGDGATIAANAVILHDVPAGASAAGAPAPALAAGPAGFSPGARASTSFSAPRRPTGTPSGRPA